MEETRNLPQNLIRKSFALMDCIHRLERLKSEYRPIFEDDPGVASLIGHLHAEREALMVQIRQHPDYLKLIEQYWEAERC